MIFLKPLTGKHVSQTAFGNTTALQILLIFSCQETAGVRSWPEHRVPCALAGAERGSPDSPPARRRRPRPLGAVQGGSPRLRRAAGRAPVTGGAGTARLPPGRAGTAVLPCPRARSGGRGARAAPASTRETLAPSR